jgi:hypothetical protein
VCTPHLPRIQPTMTLTTDREDVQFPVKEREDNSAPYMTAENASGMHKAMFQSPGFYTRLSRRVRNDQGSTHL